ncbi:Ribosomal protein L29 [Candidatus Omnitrophus magneticus]|uniref:Large ribosomal subunit protein uL29 n=1 Tax=Candidatus Omnitrophus magneticus TaxID=1609969 RepID=A0A0F0CM65_9BACT|nr:Ribosomal protein L29 [Candidatus Omnitrophus magneticus]
MKAKDIRNMTPAEIEQNISSLKEKYFNFRLEKISGRIERPQEGTKLKKDIARCYTVLKEIQREK